MLEFESESDEYSCATEYAKIKSEKMLAVLKPIYEAWENNLCVTVRRERLDGEFETLLIKPKSLVFDVVWLLKAIIISRNNQELPFGLRGGISSIFMSSIFEAKIEKRFKHSSDN